MNQKRSDRSCKYYAYERQQSVRVIVRERRDQRVRADVANMIR
jgi:hypothetical protein